MELALNFDVLKLYIVHVIDSNGIPNLGDHVVPCIETGGINGMVVRGIPSSQFVFGPRSLLCTYRACLASIQMCENVVAKAR